jgi:thioredoxin 1
MKSYLTLLISFLGCNFIAITHLTSMPVDHHDLQKSVFYNDYLNAEDSNVFLYMFASQAITENNSSLTPSELVEAFKSKTQDPEMEKRFLALYTSEFTNSELEDVSDLLQNPHYMKYRSALEWVRFKCHHESQQIFEELVKTVVHRPTILPVYDIIQVTQDNVDGVINSSRPVIIDVYADWCGPCKLLAPIIDELNLEYGNRYQFAKINGGEEEALTDSLEITGFPTIIFYKDGKEAGRIVGFTSKDKLVNAMQQYFE